MSQFSQQKKEIVGIILAAGTGSRMKQTKQLLSYRGKPLLQHIIDAATGSMLAKVILVLGHEAEVIRKRIVLNDIVEVIQNPYYRSGQSGSLKVGLAAVSETCEAAMFLLGDQPLINSEVIDRIIQQYDKTGSTLVIPRYEGTRGNPVLIDQSLFKELEQLSGDTGGRELFRCHHEAIEYLDIQADAILTDIDTPEDYQRLLKRQRTQWNEV